MEALLLVVYIIGAGIMFWALALVTEEKFVPSLNAFCAIAGIPPAVAGATLMAAGASSPELFGNMIAIFITHSELGVGTIIGSELFNHMVIAAGSIRCTAGGKPLQLELGSTLRECGFYALSLFLLAYAASDVQIRTVELEHDDEGVTEPIIVVHTAQCLPLLACYGAYVWVCAGGLEKVVGKLLTLHGAATFPKRAAERLAGGEATARPMSAEMTSSVGEPAANPMAPPPDEEAPARPRPRTPSRTCGGGADAERPSVVPRGDDSVAIASKQLSETRMSVRRMSERRLSFRGPTQKEEAVPGDVAELRTPKSDGAHLYGCYLWRMSRFYTALATACVVVDEKRLRFRVERPDHPFGDLEYLAPSSRIMKDCVFKISLLIEAAKANAMKGGLERASEHPLPGAEEQRATLVEEALEKEDDEDVEDLTAWPHAPAADASLYAKGGAIGSSIFWLAALSYVMVFCCEHLGEILKIPSAVVGLTLGAVGTSLPNLVASMVVAKQGFGAMAVSNALGSNVFNIVIALGVPWTLYPLIYGKPYATMADTGVMVQILFLFAVLVVYCGVLAANNLQLPQPAQYVLVATWIGGLVFAIAHQGWIDQLEA
ncbi:calcium, potassium:sodium antiporter [Aureococcus anophagefferens]|nr:calcium, potassium:sodium antiporter [Aureococcus anophagefferens]